MPEQDLERLREFHGHLGPYVVLGLRLGEYALAKLRARRHFGLEAVVRCADQPPESCCLDGVQFSTGCTLGKRNLRHEVGAPLRASFRNRDTGAELALGLAEAAVAEALARLREQGEDAAVEYVLGLPEEALVVEEGGR